MTEVTLLNKKFAFQKESPSYLIKIILIGLLSFGSAVSFGWLLKSFFYSQDFGDLIWISVYAGAFLVFFVLQTIFVLDAGKSVLFILIESIALSIVFLSNSYYIIPVVLITFFILWWARHSGKVILENTLKIDFWHISRVVLPKAIMAVVLVVSIFSPMYLKSKNSNFPFHPSFFDSVISSSKGLIQKFFPEIDPDSSIDQIARKIAESQISQSPEANILPKAYKEQIIKQSSSALYEQISSFLGIVVDPKLKPSQILYEGLKSRFIQFSNNTKNLIFILIGALIFISIETFSIPIRIVVSVIGFLIFKFLITIGFAKVSVEERPKEVIIME